MVTNKIPATETENTCVNRSLLTHLSNIIIGPIVDNGICILSNYFL